MRPRMLRLPLPPAALMSPGKGEKKKNLSSSGGFGSVFIREELDTSSSYSSSSSCTPLIPLTPLTAPPPSLLLLVLLLLLLLLLLPYSS